MTDYSEDAPSGKPLALGEWIRKRRERMGLSQAQLAKNAGITREYLNKIERGRVNPSAKVKEKLAKALKIHLEIEHFLHARRIDDLLAAFLPNYPTCLIDPLETVLKILCLGVKKGKSPRDIFREIVKKYGLAAENLLHVERLKEIFFGEGIFLEEILLIAETLGVSPKKCISLNRDWKSQRVGKPLRDWQAVFRVMKRALQQEYKKDPDRKFNIPKWARFQNVGSRDTFRASFKDVETALDEFLNMLEIKLT